MTLQKKQTIISLFLLFLNLNNTMELFFTRNMIPNWLKIIITILGIIIYFLPCILQTNYKNLTFGLFISNLFLWRTPLPYFILFLNITENNKGIDKIIKNQKLIHETSKELLKRLINLNNNNKQSQNHNQIWKSFQNWTLNSKKT